MCISNLDVLPSIGFDQFASSLAIYECAYFYTFHFFWPISEGWHISVVVICKTYSE